MNSDHIVRITEWLMQRVLLYRPLLIPRDSQHTQMIQLDDTEEMRKLLFSTPSLTPNQADHIPSTCANGDGKLEETKIIGDKKECPVCKDHFKNYTGHKNRKGEYECCICKTIFAAESQIVEHIKDFVSKWKCCKCVKDYKDETKFRGHLRNCRYRNNKK